MLSEEQLEIFESYCKYENIFISGPGGVGKSFLIKHIVDDAKQKGINYGVTALTGCAANLLHGCNASTIHSWAGIGIAKGEMEDILNNTIRNKYKCRNWWDVELLIVDEVSMMSLKLFHLLDRLGRELRNRKLPFGGIQIIFSGDFYQLPPVGDGEDIDSYRFCFESEQWADTFDSQYVLDKTFRQTDETYIDILNQIRYGQLSSKGVKILKSRLNVSCDENMITKPVVLHPTNYDVNIINMEELEKIQEVEKTYQYQMNIGSLIGFENIIDIEPSYMDVDENIKRILHLKRKGRTIIQVIDALEKNSHFSKTRTFKVGAQVMCTVNIDVEGGIFNGSVGIITSLHDDHVKVKFNNGITESIFYHSYTHDLFKEITFFQLPIMLAWAVTIHKSQGSTLEYAEIDVGDTVFEDGQTYVALSRVKSLEGLFLKSFSRKRIKANKKVIEFYKQFYEEE